MKIYNKCFKFKTQYIQVFSLRGRFTIIFLNITINNHKEQCATDISPAVLVDKINRVEYYLYRTKKYRPRIDTAVKVQLN